MEAKQTELQTKERLPWHKPEVRRLVIRLDTGMPFKAGSQADGDFVDGRQPGID
jgi:hypothetical protein